MLFGYPAEQPGAPARRDPARSLAFPLTSGTLARVETATGVREMEITVGETDRERVEAVAAELGENVAFAIGYVWAAGLLKVEGDLRDRRMLGRMLPIGDVP